eukprot:8265910-Ditylum_brightwellii.AAC.1
MRKDDNFADMIGNVCIFYYKVDHDMDGFRASIRNFILRLAYVTATSEDRAKILKGIKEKEEEVGTMSCSESVQLEIQLDQFNKHIRGRRNRKSTTLKVPLCQECFYTINQEEVK